MSEETDTEFVSDIVRREPDQWQQLPENSRWYYTVLRGDAASQWQALEKSGFLERYGNKQGIALHTNRQYDIDKIDKAWLSKQDIEFGPLRVGNPIGNTIAVFLSDTDFLKVRAMHERQAQSKSRAGELINRLALLKWRTLEEDGLFSHIADISSHPLREEFYELQPYLRQEVPLESLSINRRVLRGGGRAVTEVRINENDFIALRNIASSVGPDGMIKPLFSPSLQGSPVLVKEESYKHLNEGERRKMAEGIWDRAAHAGELLVALRVLLGESREEFCDRSGVRKDRLIFLEQYGADSGLAPLAIKNALIKAMAHAGEKQPEWFTKQRRDQFLLQWNPERNTDEIMRSYELEEPIIKKPSLTISQAAIREEVNQRYQLLKDKTIYGDLQLRIDLSEASAGRSWSLNQLKDILQKDGKITLSFLDAFDKVFSDKSRSLTFTEGQRPEKTLVELFGKHVENDISPSGPGRPR